MPGAFTTNTFRELSEKLQAALGWLQTLGIVPNPTRHGEYQRLMKRLVTSQEAKDEGALRAEFPQFNNMLFEVHDLIEIHSRLAGKFDDGIGRQVKLFAAGPTTYLLEDVSNSSNRARDFGFELATMAALSRAGLSLDFSIPTDVAARFKHRILMFECKRPQSIESVPRLIKRAVDQLAKKYKSVNRRTHKGIVAIDITKVVNPHFNIFVARENEAIDQTMSEKLEAFASDTKESWGDIRHSRTFGVLFRLRQMNAIETEKTNRLVYGSQFLLTNTAGTGVVDMALAEDLAATILSGMHNAV